MFRSGLGCPNQTPGRGPGGPSFGGSVTQVTQSAPSRDLDLLILLTLANAAMLLFTLTRRKN